MNRDELREIIERLDAGVPRENARVSIQKYGDELDEAFIVATTNGYLRLGVEFLKAGVAPFLAPEKTLGERPHAIDVEVDYLIDEESDVRFDYFERNEDLLIRTHEESRVDRFVPFVLLAVVLAVLALALFGLVAVIKSLT